MRDLIQILPRVRPRICGVGDAALRLSAVLAAYNWRCTLALTEHAHPLADRAAGVAAVRYADGVDGLAAALADAPQGPVLLHYQAYAYAEDGRAERALAPLLAAVGTRPLLVWFHEIAADGPPWRRAFWLRAGQQRAARVLAQRAAAVTTSCAAFAAPLAAWRGAPVAPLAVASTVGEPSAVALPAAREPVALVFGSAAVRARLAASGGALWRGLAALRVREVWEVGTGAAQLQPRLAPVPVRFLGACDDAALATHLARARYGLLDYPVRVAAKSSVLAAYAAYGLVPVLARSGHGGADGLLSGTHYVALANAVVAADPARATAIAAAARAWYAGHAWAVHGAAWNARLATC